MTERGLPGADPATTGPSSRCRPGRCRCAAAAAGASAGATSAAFCDEFMVCAARVQVGPLGPDLLGGLGPRGGRDARAHPDAAARRPRRGLDRARRRGREGRIDWAPETAARWCGSRRRRRATRRRCAASCASARANGSRRSAPPARTTATSGPASARRPGRLRRADRRAALPLRGAAASRTSPCGYHPHHTVWDWSAGVGETRDGRAVGWNLVSGDQRPPRALRARDLGRRRADASRARSTFDGPRGDRLRRRLTAGIQRRGRAPQGARTGRCQVQLPPAVRDLHAARFPAGSSSRAALG